MTNFSAVNLGKIQFLSSPIITAPSTTTTVCSPVTLTSPPDDTDLLLHQLEHKYGRANLDPVVIG